MARTRSARAPLDPRARRRAARREPRRHRPRRPRPGTGTPGRRVTAAQRSRPSVGLTRRGWTVVGGSLGLLVGGRILGADELLGARRRGPRAPRRCADLGPRPRAAAPSPAASTPRAFTWATRRAVDLVVEPSGTRASPLFELTEPIDGGALRARFLVAPITPGSSVVPAYRLPTERRGGSWSARPRCSVPIRLASPNAHA